jgi:predicted ester cyclase
MSENHTQEIVKQFIEQVWNARQLDLLKKFIHKDYRDYSLPPTLSPDLTGLTNWIVATGNSFEHRTFIEDQVTEQDESIIRIKMELTHIGLWRDIEPTERLVVTEGYRFFRIFQGKIIEHRAQINGTAIESQLRQLDHKGCFINRNA